MSDADEVEDTNEQSPSDVGERPAHRLENRRIHDVVRERLFGRKRADAVPGYDLLETIGQGGFATVYRARQRSTGQVVALKVLQSMDAGGQRFERELRLAARLRHPNIVRLIDRGRLDDGSDLLVLEYVEGETLAATLARAGRLSLDDAIALMSQILDALIHAHELGAVHRDIKPSNIMVSTRGARTQALLLDFGVAGLLPEQFDESIKLTRSGAFIGTPGYAAPEQLLGAPADPRMDLYAWGLVFLECLSGERVVRGENFGQICQFQFSPEPIPIPAKISVHPLGRLLSWVTSKAAADRPRSAREVWDALVSVSSSSRAVGERAGRANASPSSSLDEDVALVGRTHALGMLCERWRASLRGHGGEVLISGEAGIGKSELLAGFVRAVDPEGEHLLSCSCSPTHGATPLAPLLLALSRWIEGRGQTPAEFLGELGLVPDDAARCSAWLREVPSPKPHGMSGIAARSRNLDAILALLGAASEQRPMLLVVEDVHWADPSLVELLTALGEDARALHMLVVATTRELGELRPHQLHLALGPLEPADAARLVRAAADWSLEPAAVDWIVGCCDGVPLYLQELTRAVVDGDVEAQTRDSGSAVPATLQPVLAARLSGLGDTLELAKVASVLGRQFTSEALAAIWTGSPEELTGGLEHMVARGILSRRGRRDPRYQFRHHLIRDAAYTQLQPARTRELHGLAADYLLGADEELVRTRPALLAHHYAAAGQFTRALHYTELAALSAARAGAAREVLTHTRRGLDWISTMTETAGLDRRELTLRSIEAPALFATQSYGSPDAERTISRALELSASIGSTNDVFLRWSLWLCLTVQGRHPQAVTIARELLASDEVREDAGTLLEAHLAVGHSMYYLPGLREGLEHLVRVIDLYDPIAHADHAYVWGQDPAVLAYGFGGLMYWLHGFPDRATDFISRGQAQARERAHPMSTALISCMKTVHHQLRREPEATRAAADELEAYAQRESMPFWAAIGRIYGCWARSCMGEPTARAMREVLEVYRATGAGNNMVAYLAMSAEVETHEGEYEAALAHLDAAQTQLERTSERRMAAEVFRLRGRVLARLGDEHAAIVAVRRARTIADGQEALSLSLRAGLDLLELLDSGEAREALALECRAQLAAVEGGRETFDHRRAARLLG